MTTSLRMRLLVGIIGGLVLLLLCFSLVVYAGIRKALTDEFDASLITTAQILAASVETDVNQVEVEFAGQLTPEFNDADHPSYYQVWTLEGKVISRSPLLGTADLPRFHGLGSAAIYRALPRIGPGRSQRAVGTTFVPRIETDNAEHLAPVLADKPLVLVVSRDATKLDAQLSFLRWLLLGATALAVGLAFGVGVFVVRRGLRPLDAIAADIAAISEDDLGTRLEGAAIAAELAPVRDRLNGLLARLEEAFERERRFTADVAHELRTPLAGLRSTIEVTLTRDRESAEYQDALSECLAIADGMQTMVAHLLMLARSEIGRITLRPEPIALADLLETLWGSFAEQATDRKIRFEDGTPRDLTLICDRDNLAIVLSNLFSNAVAYTDTGGRVWTTVRAAGPFIELTVFNTGCTLSREQAAQAFDRFWRGDTSRSATGVHSGLGLALARRIVTALGGTCSAEVTEGGVFALKLRLRRAIVPNGT